MAWTKVKMAVVAGMVVLLAAGTTVVVEKVVHKKLSNTDLAWADDPKYWASDGRVLGKLPPVMIIRPTRFPGGADGGGVTAGNRMVKKNASVKDLVDTAYGFGSTRTIFPPDMPAENYDLMYTLPGEYMPVLTKEMVNRFGYVAHTEKREADVWLLKVVNPNPPNLKPAQNALVSSMSSGGGQMRIGNQGINRVAWYIEDVIQQPVLDRTGLKGTYDVTLRTKARWTKPSRTELNQALLDQLGLELVPSREPIEMLVVEKVI